EMFIAVIWGVLICVGLMRLAPWLALVVAVFAAFFFAVAALYIQLRYHLWFSWTVPACAQTATALVWAVGYRYTIVWNHRQKVRRAFAAHVSSHVVDLIANSEYDLAPGGKEVEATILFTDLKGFSQLSEGLSPAALSRILISYFNETTRGILEQDGTVIKFIGDAVLAAWGAPLPEPRPEERAVLAALAIGEATSREIEGLRLHTRIGINTGTVLAGHLGSNTRMEYTVIGDAINVGHRLEQLNKRLGTQILASESTCAKLSNRIQRRWIGRFILAGKTSPISVWEILGPCPPDDPA